MLSDYSYSIECKAGRSNCNADALSRLQLLDIPAEIPMPADTAVLMIRIENCPDTGLSIRNLMAFPLIMISNDSLTQNFFKIIM